MKKKVKRTVWLGFPWLAVVGGFFIPCLTAAIVVWIASLALTAFNVKRYISLYDTENEKRDYEEDESALNNLLLFANIYILGLAVTPFAVVGFVLWGIYKGFVWTFRRSAAALRTHKEGLKRFFIPLFLNAALWGISLNRALTEPLWLQVTLLAVAVSVLGLSVFCGVKIYPACKERSRYITANALVLLFSVSACIAAICYPEFVSLDWCGILLIVWLAMALLVMLSLSAIILLIMSLILWLKN